MTLCLDKRQRAMLLEIGVRVWQPSLAATVTRPAPAVENINTTQSIAMQAYKTPASADLPASSSKPAQPAPSTSLSTAPASTQPAPAESPATGALTWRVGAAQALYADASGSAAVLAKPVVARWLVLLEAPASALMPGAPGALDAQNGDAGKLLGNMLQAARLNQPGCVVLAHLARSPGSASNQSPAALAQDLSQALASLIASCQPSMVLVMGRMAAQAVLQSTEPLGKLRGQVHLLHGVPAIVTQNPAYLLRATLEDAKAKAWDDLCLGLSVVQQAGISQLEPALKSE